MAAADHQGSKRTCSWPLTQAAGLLTLLLGFFAIALIIKLVLGRDAFAVGM